MLQMLLDFILIFVSIFLFVFWSIVLLKFQHKYAKEPKAEELPSLTVLIPCYNNRRTLRKSAVSAATQDYPGIKVIIINDGSTDGSGEVADKLAEEYQNIRVIHQENRGKAEALNRGLEEVDTELVACLDADSWLEKDAMRKAVAYFKDRKVGAVTLCMLPHSRKGLLGRIQWFEYIMSAYLRKLMAFIDVIYVTPGPGSVYRAGLLKRLKFRPHTLVEDTDIAFRIKKMGYRIENSITAKVFTEVPLRFIPLLKQRIRWYAGYLETVLFDHPDYIFNPNDPHLGFFVIPMNFVVEALSIYAFAMIAREFLTSFAKTAKNLILLGPDFIYLLSLPKIHLPGFMLAFAMGGLAISFAFFLATISAVPHRIVKKWKLWEMAIYFLLYMPLLYLFFTLSLLYLIKRILTKEKGWGRMR